MIDNYNDLTIEKFYELKDIDTSEGELDTIIQAIAVLSDMDDDDVMNLPLPEFNERSKKLAFIKTQPQLMKKLPDKIVINNKKYNILKDASKMKAGQYIDYKSYAKDFDSINKNLALILTTIVIPENKTYGEGYDTVELAEEFKKNVSIVMALSISNFFFRKFQSFSNNMLIYSELVMRKMIRKEKDKETKEKMREALETSRSLRSLVKSGYGLTGQSEYERFMDALSTISSTSM